MARLAGDRRDECRVVVERPAEVVAEDEETRAGRASVATATGVADAGRGARERGRARSSPQHLEVTVGDVARVTARDRRPTLARARARAGRARRQLLRLVEAEPGVADELGMAAASQVDRRKAAGERLEQRVRARVVAARGDVDVLAAKQLGELAPSGSGAETPRARSAAGGRPTKVSSKRSGSRCTSSHASASPPLRGLSDQLVATTRTGRPSAGSRLAGGWKIAGSGAFGITTGSRELDPDLEVLRRGCSCDWRRSRPRAVVHRGDPRVRAVVEAAVHTDRAVDAMHHPHVVARRTAARRRSSKLNELKRHAGVSAEIRLRSTTMPRRASSPASAWTNWFPPPEGGGA